MKVKCGGCNSLIETPSEKHARVLIALGCPLCGAEALEMEKPVGALEMYCLRCGVSLETKDDYKCKSGADSHEFIDSQSLALFFGFIRSMGKGHIYVIIGKDETGEVCFMFEKLKCSPMDILELLEGCAEAVEGMSSEVDPDKKSVN